MFRPDIFYFLTGYCLCLDRIFSMFRPDIFYFLTGYCLCLDRIFSDSGEKRLCVFTLQERAQIQIQVYVD